MDSEKAIKALKQATLNNRDLYSMVETVVQELRKFQARADKLERESVNVKALVYDLLHKEDKVTDVELKAQLLTCQEETGKLIKRIDSLRDRDNKLRKEPRPRNI